MLKLLLSNSFVMKRIVTGLTGGLAVLFGSDIAGSVSELLMDPEFIKRVFEWLGTGLMIYSAIARKDVSETKDKLDSVEQSVTEYLPKELEVDPYPGWDYDPIRGWVKDGAVDA